jgi:beta-lactamase superfamily II metal-dependent hydrolase
MSIVKSLSVGDGDMFYIRHNSDNLTIIDCCMDDGNRRRIVRELQAQSADKGIVRFISTHPDDDHIRNLTYLHEQMNLVNFYCVEK